MKKNLDLTGKLDFTDIDLTAPDIVVKDIATQISQETNGVIDGNIIPYEGHIFSYTKSVYSGLQSVLGATEKKIDIQSTLGKLGDDSKQFEFYLTTPSYKQYKYRICYIKYGMSNYPVTIVLDQNIVNDITPDDSSYVISCGTRAELEELFYKIIYSQRVIKVMQELIRINQVQKELPTQAEELTSDETNNND